MRSVQVVLLSLLFALAGCLGGTEGSEDPPDGGGPSDGAGSPAPADGDGDGVPDTDDACPGEDDTLDSDGDGTPDGCDDTPNGETDPGPPRSAVTWDISISGNAFVDGSITIQAGDTVRWTHNDGNTPHTVTSDEDSAEEFDSNPNCVPPTPVGCMTGGGTFEHTFSAVGTFGYLCSVHASMTGTITVLERHDPTPA